MPSFRPSWQIKQRLGHNWVTAEERAFWIMGESGRKIVGKVWKVFERDKDEMKDLGSALYIAPWPSPWTRSELSGLQEELKGVMKILLPVPWTWGIKCNPARKRDLLFIAVWIQHREDARECRANCKLESQGLHLGYHLENTDNSVVLQGAGISDSPKAWPLRSFPVGGQRLCKPERMNQCS